VGGKTGVAGAAVTAVVVPVEQISWVPLLERLRKEAPQVPVLKRIKAATALEAVVVVQPVEERRLELQRPLLLLSGSWDSVARLLLVVIEASATRAQPLRVLWLYSSTQVMIAPSESL